MKLALDAKLKSDLPAILKRYPAVRSAYVFGSTAIGRQHQLSDVDIGLRIDDRLSAEGAFDLKLKLAEELETLFGSRVDVVILNTASLQMIHQAISGGRLLYATEPDAERDFYIRKRKAYFDFKYTLRNDRAALHAFFDR